MGKTRDLFKKIRDTKGTFNAPTLGREKPKARKNSTLQPGKRRPQMQSTKE